MKLYRGKWDAPLLLKSFQDQRRYAVERQARENAGELADIDREITAIERWMKEADFGD